MQRELNPELFGVKTLHDDAPLSLNTGKDVAMSGGLQMPSGNRVPASVAMEVKTLEAQIHQLRMQLQNSEKKNEQLMSQMQQLISGINTRFERTGQTMGRLETSMNHQIAELGAKFSEMASKISERKVQEVKVQEMIDRHNGIVRTFENRLTHMQRVVTEQEMQLHNYAAALEEARHEIARMKQMPRVPGVNL